MGGNHVFRLFLNLELNWINNKITIEFSFHIIWRIMEVEEGDDTQPHSIIDN